MQVTASNLIGLNDDNEVVEGSGEPELSAATIHRGVHQSRPDARAVFHLHMPYSTALGELTCMCVCVFACLFPVAVLLSLLLFFFLFFIFLVLFYFVYFSEWSF